MPVDPTPFLSTIVATSAALVAIIGGLLVARFVGLDADERTSRRVLADARERLELARVRADLAWQRILSWDARNFFTKRAVVAAIVDYGAVSPDVLMQLASWTHEADELAPFAADVAEDVSRARETIPGYIRNGEMWEEFRARPGLPEIRWPGVWERVYAEIAEEHAKAEEAKQKAEEARRKAEEAKRLAEEAAARGATSPLLGSLLAGFAEGARFTMPPAIDPRIFKLAGPPSDVRATNARRFDDMLTDHAKGQQQVEDLEGELRRIEQEHAEIVRPDARLWWGVGILVIFTALGVALPLWEMSQGPDDLAAVRWVFWPFAGSLAALIIYIVVYLVQLTRKPGRDNESPSATAGAPRLRSTPSSAQPSS